MRARYAALFGFCVALAIVHAIVAFWTPIQGDDWTHWIWAGQHRSDDSWWLAWLRAHLTFSDALGYVLARCRSFHVLVTPVAMIALVIGLYTVAVRRLPRATWEDLLGIALTSALVWITQPLAGVTLFHMTNVAIYVYGATIAVWFVAPLRCGWNVSPRWWPVLIAAGYCVGTSSRAIATATLVAMAIAMWRGPRMRWMWLALAGLVVGTVVGYLDPPWIELGRVFRRGFEQNLVGKGLVKYIVAETGELVSFVAAFVLLDLVLGMLGRARAPADARPDPTDTLRWLVAWFATALWCLFGPKYNEAATLPATCMLVIAAVPYFLWLARSPWLRYALIAIIVVVHAVVWIKSIATYREAGAEGAARFAAIEATAPGRKVVVRPYTIMKATFWFYGEDFDRVRTRQLVATEAFELADIVLEPSFRNLERNPDISFAFESDGLTAEQLQAARVPRWASEVSAARTQFELFVKRLRKLTASKFAARLVAENMTFSQARGRRVLAAWADETGTMIPRVARSPADAMSRYTIRIYGRDARRFNEAWLVTNGTATSIPYRNSLAIVQPLTIRLINVVFCNDQRCLLGDAFVPRF